VAAAVGLALSPPNPNFPHRAFITFGGSESVFGVRDREGVGVLVSIKHDYSCRRASAGSMARARRAGR
jgi:hypothetical protein